MACGAAASVFKEIKEKSQINPCSNEGKVGKDCKGEIEFKNVYFDYPSRPGGHILKGLSFKIKPGEIVAIVGGSGCGKSTVLQLIQRLYDPLKGKCKRILSLFSYISSTGHSRKFPTMLLFKIIFL